MSQQSAQTNNVASKGLKNSSGAVRNGNRSYIIDGEVVKGLMLRWKKYRSRIDEIEREAGYIITKKGKRMRLSLIAHAQKKRDADEAELPEETVLNGSPVESKSSESDDEKMPPQGTKEAKKKSPLKMSIKPKKRQRTQYLQ